MLQISVYIKIIQSSMFVSSTYCISIVPTAAADKIQEHVYTTLLFLYRYAWYLVVTAVTAVGSGSEAVCVARAASQITGLSRGRVPS